MKRKLFAAIMAIAMLASLSVPAFAGQTTNSGGSATTYTYSNTSDALSIVNKSNIDVKVQLDVQFSGMSDATFAGASNVTTTSGGAVIPTPDKSLYVALMVSGDSVLPVDAAGSAAVTKIIPKAEDGAYEWKVSTNSGGDKEYIYELQDSLKTDSDASEFSRISFKLTGAVSKTGWEDVESDSNFDPRLVVTWNCSTVSGDTTNSGGSVTPTPQTSSNNSGNSGATTGSADSTGSGGSTGSGDSRFNAFNGGSTNQVRFEGNAPPEIVNMVVPTDADGAFQFILDPNGRIQATNAKYYDSAVFDYGADTNNPNRLFFRNASTGGSSGSSGSGASAYTGAKATVSNPWAAVNDVATITISYGDSGMTTVKNFKFTSNQSKPMTITPSSSNTYYKLVSDTELQVKALAANFSDPAGDYQLVLTNANGETLTLDIDVKTAGAYGTDGPLS